MKIQVCTGKSCSGKFSKYIKTRIVNDIQFYTWKDVEVIDSPCMGQCKKGANMKIKNQTHNYMNPAIASEIISKEIK